MRRLLATLLTLAGLAGIGILTAAPAQAACPVASSTILYSEWPPEYLRTRTDFLYCDDGDADAVPDDHIRLTGPWRYDDTNAIRKAVGLSSSVPFPIMEFRGPNGGAYNAINGYPSWTDNFTIDPLNSVVIPQPATFVMYGKADWAWGTDPQFADSATVAYP